MWGAGAGMALASAGVLWLFAGKQNPENSIEEVTVRSTVRQPTQERREEVDAVAQSGGHLPSSSEDILSIMQSPQQSRLSSPAIQEALEYLRKPKDADSPDNPKAEYFNNIIGLLLAQPDEVVGLSQALWTAADDKSLSPLLRNYAMQHFFPAWNREKNPALKREIELRLKTHFDDPQSPLQGVALLTSSRFFEQVQTLKGPNGEKLVPIGMIFDGDPSAVSNPVVFDRDGLVSTAFQVSSNPSAASSARVCAFNVLLNLGASDSVYSARKIVPDLTVSNEVRCSAIAALGAFGNLENDEELLNEVPVQPESVRAAADHALGRLKRSQSIH